MNDHTDSLLIVLGELLEARDSDETSAAVERLLDHPDVTPAVAAFAGAFVGQTVVGEP